MTPLQAPWRRALLIAPIGVLILFGVPWRYGLRGDVDALGPVLLAGLSVVQFVAGLAFLAAAFRDAVPGRSLSRAALFGLAATAAVVVLGITLLTEQASATRVPHGAGWLFFRICMETPALIGLPILAVTTLLAFRAFPVRPIIAGALAGMGSGLLTDSGWRLYCHVSDPAHVLPAHGGAILLLGIIGAAAAHIYGIAKRG